MPTLEERVKELEERVKPFVWTFCTIDTDGTITGPDGDVLTKEEYEQLKAKHSNKRAYFITMNFIEL